MFLFWDWVWVIFTVGAVGAFSYLFGLHDGRGFIKEFQTEVSAERVRLIEGLRDVNLKLYKMTPIYDRANDLLKILMDNRQFSSRKGQLPDSMLEMMAPDIYSMFERKDKRWRRDAIKILSFITTEQIITGVVSWPFNKDGSPRIAPPMVLSPLATGDDREELVQDGPK